MALDEVTLRLGQVPERDLAERNWQLIVPAAGENECFCPCRNTWVGQHSIHYTTEREKLVRREIYEVSKSER